MNKSGNAYTRTNDLLLRFYEEQDAPSLYRINTNSEIQYLLDPNSENVSFSKFKQKLERRLDYRWDHYFVVERRRDKAIIGFAYCYGAIEDSAIAYICICIDKPYMNSIVSLRASYLFLSYLFIDQHYRKLYAEVFGYNYQVIKLLEKTKFVKEGCLAKHQLWGRQFWDLHIFTLTQESYHLVCQENKSLVKRLSCSTQKN
ncbi:MAG: GNAT family protein [Candidatus Thiodiazotropha sp.]|jgi:RimJ/RimL family protein N-acetyltransferase